MSNHVVLIHSTGLGPFMWAPYLPLLGEASALCPTNLGYAPGTELQRPQRVSLADEVNALARQLASLDGGIHVVAHSYGGLLALELARAGALDLRSLYLYEPVLFASLRERVDAIDDAAATEVQALYRDPTFYDDDAHGGDEAWLERFVDYWNRPGAWQAMSDRARAAMRRVGWKMHLEVRAVSTAARPFEAYRVDLPTTIVAGSRSTAAARAMARELAGELPHAESVTLDGVGHMGVLDAVGAVGPSLQAHLRRAMG
jgi:pimeloyl-ACP methyl ester carboxylesterase